MLLPCFANAPKCLDALVLLGDHHRRIAPCLSGLSLP